MQTLQYQGYIRQLLGNGIPYSVTLDGLQKYSEKLQGQISPFWSFMQVLPKRW